MLAIQNPQQQAVLEAYRRWWNNEVSFEEAMAEADRVCPLVCLYDENNQPLRHEDGRRIVAEFNPETGVLLPVNY